MTTEIPQKLWEIFCRQLNDLYRGAVSIRLIEPNGEKKPIVDEVPLRSVALQHQSECNDAVMIEAGREDERPLQHQIIEPIRIVLWQDGESGRFHHAEILAESGTTEIDFHPGINSGILERLAA